MKKVIEGTTYNTETAKELGVGWNGKLKGDAYSIESDAKRWAEKNLTVDEYEAIWGLVEENEETPQYKIDRVTNLNDMQGYYFAKDSKGGPIILDPWLRGDDRTNSNITILGDAGMGKTIATKHLILNEFTRGTKVIIIDPMAEYVNFTQNLNGDVINIGGDSKSKINILQIKPSPKMTKNDLEEDETDDLYEGKLSEMALHIKNLEIFFKLYKKDFSDFHIAYLKKALIALYNKFNITWDTDVSRLKNEDFPIMSDLYEILLEKERNSKEDRILNELVLLLLDDIANGADSFIFNGHTSIETKSNIVCLNTYNIQSSSEAVKKAQYFNILNWAWEQLIKDKDERVMLICDEAYLLIDPHVPQTAAFLRNVEKICHKFKASLVLIFCSIVDFLHKSIENYSQVILYSPAIKLIFRAGRENLYQISKLFNLNATQTKRLALKERANALLLIENKKMHIKFDIPEDKFKYLRYSRPGTRTNSDL